MSEVKRFYEKISEKQTVYREVRIWYKDAHYTDTEKLCVWFVCQPNYFGQT